MRWLPRHRDWLAGRDVVAGHELRNVREAESFGQAFSPGDGKWLISGGAEGTIRLWDTATGKEIEQFFPSQAKTPPPKVMPPQPGATAAGVQAVAFSPDGAIVVGAIQNALTTGEAETRKVKAIWRPSPSLGTRRPR